MKGDCSGREGGKRDANVGSGVDDGMLLMVLFSDVVAVGLLCCWDVAAFTANDVR